MILKNIYDSKCWLLVFVYILIQSYNGTLSQPLATEDAQFISDFISSSPGFAATFANEDICASGFQFTCDTEGHLVVM